MGVAATTPWAWLGDGFRESLAMVWLTWWPLVLGFGLSGLVQSLAPRDGLRERLGVTSPSSVARAAGLGVLSSSCSYAASAMARALFARGASWSNSLVFMVASTNLVIELGVVLYVLLGGAFLVAQLVGGVVMVALLALAAGRVFGPLRETSLRERVRRDAPPAHHADERAWSTRLRDATTYARAARYSLGDLTMVKFELAAGFVAAGFLSEHVPNSWWSHVFVSGHGLWTAIENAALAPLVALLASVCSVGNIPLAAALWGKGVAFGGVVAFVFADLLAFPLVLIYRRFYGGRATWRLVALLWVTMSLGGLVVNALFSVAHAVPSNRHPRVLDGDFPMGANLVLNVLATLILVAIVLLARRGRDDANVATDPVCGMTVDVHAPAATLERDGVTFYFCSPRCRDRFVAGERGRLGSDHDHDGDERSAIDPVCGMSVSLDSPLRVPKDGVTYYFCGEGCRRAFLDGPAPTTPVTLRMKAHDE